MGIRVPDKEFRDPIHGFIPIYKEEREIIDDPIYQRLRRIKQLSFAYTVYHGAEHSRFGHCLGAMHTIDRALTKIQKNCNIAGISIDISEDDVKLARFAALLHDVGHFPFSHALDGLLDEQHEAYSAKIVEECFAGPIEEAGINSKDVTKLILGQPPLEKPYLTALISSQLDVDKFDYLLRDSHYTGVKYGIFDLERLLDCLLIVETDLKVSENDYYSVEQMILARYYMFEQVYLHKTKRAFEGMARKVAKNLIENDKFEYPTPDELKDKEGRKRFASLDDNWFLRILDEKSDEKSKKIVDSILFRNPYRVVIDSNAIKKAFRESEDAGTGIGVVRVFENVVRDTAPGLGIDDYEIVFDQFSNVPYKLRPYTKAATDESETPDIIEVFNKKTNISRPIEEKSIIVSELARSKIRTRRIYVSREKSSTMEKFLKREIL